MNELLRVKNLHKYYDNHNVLSNINFSIEKGEFLSLLGPSGCGKTTLLKLISGFDTPDSGEIYYQNHKISHLPPQKRSIHTVFQHYALFPHLSVYENIAFPLRAQGLSKKDIDKKVLITLNQVKLTSLKAKYPFELSGGQQQRVAIARAIINKPELILLDESLSALDHTLRKEMQIELKQLQRQLGIAFIYVTHSQEEALSMSERVIVLGKGKVQQIGTPREIYETPKNIFVASFIGDSNVFKVSVIKTSEKNIQVLLENKLFSLKNPAHLKEKNTVNVIIRPEDWKILPAQEVTDKKNHLEGAISEVIYKGSTVDLRIKLISGKIISASEFFNEEDENLNYIIGEQVCLSWPKGWEVVLPDEN